MLRNCRGNRLGKINQFFRDDIGKSAILCEKVHRLERNGLFFRDDYNNTMDMPSPDIQQDNQVLRVHSDSYAHEITFLRSSWLC